MTKAKPRKQVICRERQKRQANKKHRKQNRRNPYTNETRLSDLVLPSAYDRMDIMFRALRPFLADYVAARRSPYIEFDLDKLKGRRAEVYRAIAKFLYCSSDETVLKVSVAAFARYMTDPIHGNFSTRYKTFINRLLDVDFNKL